MDRLIESIKENEGFRGDVYNDTLGYPTIGYGTKLPITSYEAELILRHRLEQKIKSLVSAHNFIITLPTEVQEVLYEMGYQMGVSGVNKFKKMWKALDNKDYIEAANQMIDSKWAEQTPNRANKLANIVRNAV